MQKNKQKLNRANEKQQNYRLYKAKKQWITACATVFLTFGASAVMATSVQADEVASTSSTTETAEVASSSPTSATSSTADDQRVTAVTSQDNSSSPTSTAKKAIRTASDTTKTASVAASAANDQTHQPDQITLSASPSVKDDHAQEASTTTLALTSAPVQTQSVLSESKATTTDVAPVLNSAFKQDTYMGYVVQGSNMNEIVSQFLTNSDAIKAAGGKITWDGPATITADDITSGQPLSGNIIVTYPDLTKKSVTAYFMGVARVTANANLQANQNQTGFLYVPKVGDKISLDALDINNTAIFNRDATNSIIPTTDSMGVDLSAKIVGNPDTSTIGFHDLTVEVTDNGNAYGMTVIGSPYKLKVPYLVQTLEPISEKPVINVQKITTDSAAGSSPVDFQWPWFAGKHDDLSDSGSGIGRYFYKDFLKYFALGGNLYVSSGIKDFGTVDNPAQEITVRLTTTALNPQILTDSPALPVKLNWINSPTHNSIYIFKDPNQTDQVVIKRDIIKQLNDMNDSDLADMFSKIILADGQTTSLTAFKFSKNSLNPMIIVGLPSDGKYTTDLNLTYGEGQATANGFIPDIFSKSSVMPEHNLLTLLQKYNPNLSTTEFSWGQSGTNITYSPTQWVNMPVDIYSINIPKNIEKPVDISNGPQSFTADELQGQYLKQLTYGTTNATSADWPVGTTFEFVGGDVQDGKITMDAPGQTNTTQLKITLPGGSTTTIDVKLTTDALKEKQREVKVRYLDSDENDKLISIGDGFKIGEIGDNVSFTLSIPENYELKPNQSGIKDNTLTYKIVDEKDENGVQYANVYLIHKTEKITDPSQAKIQETRTATVNYIYGTDVKDTNGNVIHAKGSQAATSAVLDVYYTRTAVKDLVTDNITYGNWQWDSSKSDDGYSNGYKVVSGKWTSLPTSWSPVIADVPSLNGFTAWTKTSQTSVPTNKFAFPTYVNNGTSQADGNSTAYTPDADTYEARPVHTVWYLPVETEARTITENYKIINDQGQIIGDLIPSEQVQVFYTKKASNYNEQTGQVTYGEWTWNQQAGDKGFHIISGIHWKFPESSRDSWGVSLPSKEGYTAVNIAQNGSFDTSRLGNPNSNPDTIFTTDTGTVYMRNNITTYYVANSNLKKDIKRTITINVPNEKSTIIAQNAQISRSVKVNNDDSGVVFGDWSTGSWAKYSNIPNISGYTPYITIDGVEVSSIPQVTVTSETKDSVVVINYIQNTANVTINHAEVDQTYNGQPATIPDSITHLITPAEHITLPKAVNQVIFTSDDYSFVNTDGTIIATPTNVGTYHIILNQRGLDKLKTAALDFTFNYDPKTSYVIYKITPAQVSATLSGTATATYNDQDITSVSSNRVKVIINADPSLIYDLQSGDYEFVQHDQVVTPKNAGTYEIRLTQAGINHITKLGGSNYNWFTNGQANITQNAKLVISKVTPTVTINGAATKTYDGTAISGYAPQVTISAPGTSPVTLTAGDFEFNVNGKWTTNAPVDAGSYQVRLTEAGLKKIIDQNASNIDWADNYQVEGDYVINKASAVATLSSNGSKVYDGQPAQFAINGTDFQVTGMQNNDKVNLLTLTQSDFTWTDVKGITLTQAPTDAGTYTVTLNQNGIATLERANPNYTFTSDGDYTYVIEKAAAVVNTSGTQTIAWSGKAVPVDPGKFTNSITTNNDLALSVPDSVKLTADDYDFVNAQGEVIPTPTAVGNYYVKLNNKGLEKVEKAIGNSNYTWQVGTSGNYNIGKAEATVTLSGNAKVIYSGSPAQIPTDVDGTVVGIKVTLSNGQTYNLKTSDLEFVNKDHTNVGTYQLKLSDAGLNNIKAVEGDNYTYTYDDSHATLEVTPATATYELRGSQSETYSGKAYADDVLIPEKYSIKITTNNGQTLNYTLQKGDIAFLTGFHPTNKGTYPVGITEEGLKHLKALNSNFNWNLGASASTATFEITAKQMTVNITGEVNSIYDGNPQGVPSDQLNKLGFTWAGETTKPDQITSVDLTTNDFDYYQQDANGNWQLIKNNDGLPLHAGTYGLKLKQSVIDALNNKNANGNYTFTNGDQIAARFIINQRQARVTLSGSQTAPYTENGPLDVNNFKVQLTDTSTEKPITVDAANLTAGDLIIKGYKEGNYPKLVGTYDVEMTQQLSNKLKQLYPDYKFESNEVISKTANQLATTDLINNSGDSDVVDRNNDGKYVVTPLDAIATLTGGQTINYGQSATIDYSKYKVTLTNNKNDQALKDADGKLITFTLQDGDLAFEKIPGNVGDYQVVLTGQATKRLEALGLNPIITDTTSPEYPSSGTDNYQWSDYINDANFIVEAMPVNIAVDNGENGPQTSVFGNPIKIDTGHYAIAITTEDGKKLTYTLQSGDLTFKNGTPKGIGTFDLELSSQGLANIEKALNIDAKNYSFHTPTSTATYVVEAATPTIRIIANGESQKTYDGQPAQIKDGDYKVMIESNASEVTINSLNGNSLKFVDDSAPTNAGTYQVELTSAAIDQLKTQYPNFDWSKADTVIGNYKIVAASAKAELNGQNSMIYTGKPVTTADLNANGGTIKVVISIAGMTKTIDYQLQDNDYTWIAGSTPVNASETPYALVLNKNTVLTHLQDKLNQEEGNSNVIISAENLSGSAEFTINKAQASATLSGTQNVTYTNSVPAINPDDFKITLDNGEVYQLQAKDLQYVDQSTDANKNVGRWQVELTEQGKANIAKLSSNYRYNYTGKGNVVINKTLVSQNEIKFSGNAEKTFDGTPIADYQPTVTITAPGASSIILDPNDYDYHFVRHDGTDFTKAPFDAGVYDVYLTQAGIDKIKDDNSKNLDWSRVDLTGKIGTYTINQATASANLQGAGTKSYDGIAVNSGELEHQGFKIVITVPKADGTNATQTVDYTLRDGDYTWTPSAGAVLDENGNPINVGTYDLKLTQKAAHGIMAKINADIKLNGNIQELKLDQITGSATFTINPKSITLSQTGSGSQVFNNANNITSDQIVTGLVDQGLVSGQTLKTTGLSMVDFNWYNADGTKLDGVPVNVGTYTVKLNQTGLNKLQINMGANYKLDNLPTGAFNYTITAASASATLTGLSSKIYDGNSTTTAQINAHGNIKVAVTVTLGDNQTESMDYTLQAGDYTWTNGAAPINVGTTSLKLSDSAKDRIQNAVNAQYGQGNVIVSDPTGSADFTINPFKVTITTTGQTTVNSGTTTIPTGVYHLNVSGDGQMPTGWSGILYNDANFGFDGPAPTTDTKAGTFTVNYLGGQPALQDLLGANYEVAYTPAKDNYMVQDMTPTQGQQVVDYVDQSGTVITSHTVTGDKGSEVDFNVTENVPTNWRLVTPTNQTQIKISGDTTKFIIEHKLQDLADDTKTVTRTIVEHIPGAPEPTTQTQSFEFTRTAKQDLVTGEIINGDWNAASHTFDAVTPQTIIGYTASPSQVGALTVTPASANMTVNVYYTAVPTQSQQVIRFVGSDGTVIRTLAPIAGTKGSVISTTDMNLAGQIPDKWKLADGQPLPTSITIDGGYTDIKIVHATTTQTSNKTVTRIINVINPDGRVDSTKQVATLSRTDTVDLVDGNITEGTWKLVNDISWDAVKIPMIPGYTPSQSTVEAVTPTVNTQDQIINITYTANTQNSSVIFVDDDNSDATVLIDPISGKTGQTISLDLQVPKGYQLAKDQTLPTSYTFKANDNDPLTVHLVHSTITIEPTAPKTSRDKLPDDKVPGEQYPDGDHYPTGVAENDLNKIVIRTINVTNPTGQTETIKQETKFSRSATIDLVTGDVTYSAWTQNSTNGWTAYTPTDIKGYTPSQAKVAGITVTPDTKDETVNITYTANEQMMTIRFVDDDENDKQVGETITEKGVTNETIDLSLTIPANYQLANGQTLPTSYKFTADQGQTITIHLVHGTEVINPDMPDKPSQIKDSDWQKDVIRTINVIKPGATQSTTTKQVAEYTRSLTFDKVTNSVINYGDWQLVKNGWTAVTIPEVAGYTAHVTPANSNLSAVAKPSRDETINITYTVNEQTGKISYIDGNGQEISSSPLSGQTGETIPVNINQGVPAGWQIVPDQTIPSEVTAGPTGIPTVTVKIEHGTITVDPNNPQTQGTDLPAGTTTGDKYPDPGKYPSGVTESDLNKTVIRTINVTDPAGHTETIKQETKFDRTATIDLVTGKVTYSAWNQNGTNGWTAYTAAMIDGYTPSQAEVPATIVTPDTKDETINITYTAGEQRLVIKFVDDDDRQAQVGSLITKLGTTAETIDLGLTVPTNYQLAPGQSLPTTYTFIANKDQTIVVHLVHGQATIQPSDPNKPSNIKIADWQQTFTRRITVTKPGENPITTVQTATYVRSLTVDEVTGQIINRDAWQLQNNSWTAFELPEIAGYTAEVNPANSNLGAVAHPNQDETVNITYIANEQTGKISYVDGNGQEISSSPLTGQTGETISVNVNQDVPAGWQIVPGQTIPSEVTAGSDGIPTVTVKIKHGTITVDPDNPHTPGTDLPEGTTTGNDYPDPGKYPSGVTKDDLNKKVTRTIVEKLPGGERTITQTVTLQRTATIDLVTGQVSYGQWSTGHWAAFTPESVTGFTASPAMVDQQTVTAQTSDQTVVINYVANSNSDQPATPVTSDHGGAANTADHNGQPITPTSPNGGSNTKDQPATFVNDKQSQTSQNTQVATGSINARQTTKTGQLPQTGNETDHHAGLLGLALAGLTTALTALHLKKKRD